MAGLSAALLTAIVIPTALGWAGSNITCDATNWICVSRDDGNGTPRAVTGSNDNDYRPDYYYNTTDNINDTVSSIKNRSLTEDVYFWQDPGYGGNHYCLDADWYNADLGWVLWPDNNFGSHQKVSGDSC